MGIRLKLLQIKKLQSSWLDSLVQSGSGEWWCSRFMTLNGELNTELGPAT